MRQQAVVHKSYMMMFHSNLKALSFVTRVLRKQMMHQIALVPSSREF